MHNKFSLKSKLKINKITIPLLALGLIFILSGNIGYSSNFNDVDYKELENIRSQSLANAAQYQNVAKDAVKTSRNTQNIANASMDKQWFINKQQELLNDAYSKQDKPKDNASKLIVFISLSMPEEALKELLIASRQYDAALVIQGLVNNSFPETINKITDLVKISKNTGGIQIEPNLFERYKITTVPAFVINYSSDLDSDFDIVYGASGIKSALDIFAAANTKASPIARGILHHG